MPRLYLFAEGPTERTFADTMLKPHLANLGVYLHPPILIAHASQRSLDGAELTKRNPGSSG